MTQLGMGGVGSGLGWGSGLGYSVLNRKVLFLESCDTAASLLSVSYLLFDRGWGPGNLLTLGNHAPANQTFSRIPLSHLFDGHYRIPPGF